MQTPFASHMLVLKSATDKDTILWSIMHWGILPEKPFKWFFKIILVNFIFAFLHHVLQFFIKIRISSYSFIANCNTDLFPKLWKLCFQAHILVMYPRQVFLYFGATYVKQNVSGMCSVIILIGGRDTIAKKNLRCLMQADHLPQVVQSRLTSQLRWNIYLLLSLFLSTRTTKNFSA